MTCELIEDELKQKVRQTPLLERLEQAERKVFCLISMYEKLPGAVPLSNEDDMYIRLVFRDTLKEIRRLEKSIDTVCEVSATMIDTLNSIANGGKAA